MNQVLLSTYNGSRYLAAQLESLRGQTQSDFELLVRDDGSTDDTRGILERAKIPLLTDNLGNLGPMRSFAALLGASTTPYVFCCDQDDFWLPQKIERMLGFMRQLESKHGRATPLLLHHDLRVVGGDLNTIADSFWGLRGFDLPKSERLNRLLLQNVVTGCALMANRALLDKALPIPANAVMHDWWLALVASAFGVIESIPEPLVLYRQHGNNSLGARGFSVVGALQVLSGSVQLKPDIGARMSQGRAFLERFEPDLDPGQISVVKAFVGLSELSWLRRRQYMARYDFQLPGLARNLAWWLIA